MPTREDYIAMGVDPAVLDRIEREKDEARRQPDPDRSAAPRRDARRAGAYFVLEMAEDHEQAARRFMDEGFDAGVRDHGPWKPSDLWVLAWTWLGMRHLPRLGPWWPVVPKSFRTLSPPCSLGGIMILAAKPSHDRELAEHSATIFCREALNLSRMRYRSGFYGDPFTRSPTKRGQA